MIFVLTLLHYLLPHSNSYTFVSYFEAYAISGGGLCLGDCVQITGFSDRYICIINYKGVTVPCRPTNVPTKHYRTINNQQCYSNCGNFDGESYEWCVVKTTHGSTWDYCTSRLALEAVETVRTDNKYMTCGYTTCYKHNYYSYDWCGTIGTYWEYCNPDNKVLLIKYLTYANTLCASPCETNLEDLPYCYDVYYDWTRCYLNPTFYTQAHNVYYTLDDYYTVGGIYTVEGYKGCIGKLYRIQNDEPPKQSNETIYVQYYNSPRLKSMANESMFLTSIRKVAQYYTKNNPTVALRNQDWQAFAPTFTNYSNPVVAYTVLPIVNVIGMQQLNLPLAVYAVITNLTIQSSATPKVFTNDINRYLAQMDFNYGHTNYDDPGYVIGHKLGGPTEKYNMFPQTWKYNRGDKNKYRHLENDIETFLIIGTQRYVDYVAILVYQINNGVFLHRPIAIGVSVRLYDSDFLVNLKGDRITSVDNNLEDMYFVNDPLAKCLEEE
ncbi:ORF22 [Xestia c-nigrum granulovirus]|uniref:ORF22 n=1 Tax=Xestia c-nigrum granulosis virus TaxID=51677 RepID=Q9PZ21_GVXN|nr:ORF22 [Xestia c-nigrum granulovirus]AAF05136.1 ORF22 [Xestia c-nigrum granulovirus]